VYGVGLIMYELFTGGGPHLTAPWPPAGDDEKRDEHMRIKRSLAFPRPSESHNEIRNDCRWLDDLILRCLALDPGRRFADAGQVLTAIEACEAGGELPPPPDAGRPPVLDEPPPTVPPRAPDRERAAEVDDLFREVRKLLAGKAYDQVIDRLDIHRPAEWQTIDHRAARTLRALGQAYLGRGDLNAARDCLEQLRAAQKEQAVLSRQDHAAALSDLVKCYRALGYAEVAEACQEEVRLLLQS
jgi:tetratricopeptide (TPR) repeat protein